jgi:hypothetical protein
MMLFRRWYVLLGIVFLASTGITAWIVGASAQGSSTVRGVVVDAGGPISGAHVRVRATENLTYSKSDGSFILGGLDENRKIEVTAWADGYYIASTYVTPTVSGITLTLRPYHTSDHPDYDWVSPVAGTSEVACGNCHPMILPQWENNAHGGAISNNRFYSLYNGTNLSGTVTIGPGYLNDFPGTSGVCSNCHAPGAGVDGYLTTNMNDVRDELTSGIHCDFCHKIGGAYLNPGTGTVYPNTPGVTSLRVLRPPIGDQIFFGPYDDIHDPDTYLPLISESQFCAACHQFSFWGTPIYESYEEWLASDYASEGVTCQNCHMPPNGDTFFALPEVGGLEHPPEKIPSHLQLGATNIELLQNTVSMDVTAQQILDRIVVTVTITNTGAGHHVPTDFPGRQMILVLTATDEQNQPLLQKDGSALPDWSGPQAGKAGTAFAKLLQDVETGEFPVVSYWKQTFIISDNRIPAFDQNISTYSFAISTNTESAEVITQLFFRRAFQSLATQKDWNVPDILMEEKTLALSLKATHYYFLPFISTDPTSE